MSLRDTIENNPVLWTLSTLLVGFIAGFGVYQSILKVAGRQVISESVVVLKPGEQAISSEEYDKLKGMQRTFETISRRDEILRMKQIYLANCIRYYETRDHDHILAKKIFIDYITTMWHQGNQDMTKNGYYIHKNNDDLADSHIVFEDTPTEEYKIPRDVKDGVLLPR